MKTILIFLIITIASIQLHAKEMTISFSTSIISGGEYSPKHILAIWVKGSGGNYQKTLMVYADERKRYLQKWNSQTGGDNVDALTGATLSSHKTHAITWNVKNILNQDLPDGNYKLCMEITSSDFAGPFREIDFTVNSSNYTLTPDNGSNFKDITIDFKGTPASVESLAVEGEFMNIYPNPSNGNDVFMELKLLQNSPTIVKLYSIDGQVINSKSFKLFEGINKVELSKLVLDLKKGSYVVKVETNHYTIGKQLIIK